MKEQIKRGPGRPPLSPTGEAGKRYQVHLLPSVADKLKAYGDGSISQGIIRLVTKRRIRTNRA